MNFGAARLGFWFRNVDRASKSKKVLVFYDPWTYVAIAQYDPNDGSIMYAVINNWYDYDVNPGNQVWPTLRDREIANGFEPELVVGYDNLPADMSQYAHIWDIGYCSPYASNPTFNPTSTLQSYIVGGGAMFMLGENISLNQTFPGELPDYTRDNTITVFLGLLGSGIITMSQVDVPSATTIIQPQFLIVNNNNTLKTNRPGAYIGFGTGTAMTTPTITTAIDSAYPAIMWTTGKLTNAPLGAIISVLDINFLVGGDIQADFIDNLIASLNQR